MSYILQHTMFGFCWWDLPAVIALLAIVVYYVVRYRNMKKEQSDLEDQLSELYAEDVQTTPEEM